MKKFQDGQGRANKNSLKQKKIKSIGAKIFKQSNQNGASSLTYSARAYLPILLDRYLVKSLQRNNHRWVGGKKAVKNA